MTPAIKISVNNRWYIKYLELSDKDKTEIVQLVKNEIKYRNNNKLYKKII